MSKTGWIGVVGGTLIVLAMILVFSDDPEPVAPETGEEQASQDSGGEAVQLPETPTGDESSDEAQSASGSESGDSAMNGDSSGTSVAESSETDASGTGADGEQDATAPDGTPSFDVIRIDRTGDAVIAGRAAPGAEVTLLDGDEVLGTVTADGRGEWVFLPSTPLEPGSHELRLRAQSEGMEPIFGGDAVVMVVPERGQDIAGRETDDPEAQEPLVLLIPDQGQPGVEVVQVPRADGSEGTDADSSTGSDADAQQIGQTATAEPGGVQSSDGALAVDTIDYDPQGNIAIAGRGPADSDVVAYLDNSPLGGSPVGADGNWRISPDREVAPGVYRLRLDALRDGAVISRLEIPFSRAEPLTDLDSDAFIVVQPGNSLWRIARRTLGTGFNYTIIYDANSDQIRDPDLIYPGQVFEIPR